MPALKNQKWEAFAQGLAAGKTSDQAYTDAGYAPNRGNATRLKANERIMARCHELQDRVTKAVILDRQWVLDRLIDNAQNARQRGDGGVVNRALELLGKELGMFVDRKEIRTGPLEEATPDELERLREELVSERDRRATERNGTAPSGKPN